MPEGRLSKRTNAEPTVPAKDSPLSEQPRDRAANRKRPHEAGDGGGTAVKRLKPEIANDHFCSITALNTHPSSQVAVAAAAADPSAQGWVRSRSHMTSRTPWGFTSPSESVWDARAFADYSNTWWLHSARKDLNAFRAPPLYFPSFARQQQAVHLRAAREFLQHSFCTQPQPQPSFLTPSYLWPPSWSRAAASSR